MVRQVGAAVVAGAVVEGEPSTRWQLVTVVVRERLKKPKDWRIVCCAQDSESLLQPGSYCWG